MLTYFFLKNFPSCRLPDKWKIPPCSLNRSCSLIRYPTELTWNYFEQKASFWLKVFRFFAAKAGLTFAVWRKRRSLIDDVKISSFPHRFIPFFWENFVFQLKLFITFIFKSCPFFVAKGKILFEWPSLKNCVSVLLYQHILVIYPFSYFMFQYISSFFFLFHVSIGFILFAYFMFH